MSIRYKKDKRTNGRHYALAAIINPVLKEPRRTRKTVKEQKLIAEKSG